MNAAEVQMNFERLVMEQKVTVLGVHSVVLLVEDNLVDVIYDVRPDESGSGLHFRCPLPQLVNPRDLYEFALWLAMDYRATIH